MQRTPQRSAIASLAALAALAGLGAACTPVSAQHGFVADNPDALSVQVGVDTKETVRARLGTPSTVSALEGEAWYYVSQTQERFAFYTPETVARTVIAVRFDDNDVVAGFDRFGLERGRVVSINGDETPTRGRELGLVEQIFGNIGRGGNLPQSEQDQRRPGR